MVMLVCAAILLAVNFALTKCYQKIGSGSTYELLMFNALSGVFTAVIFFVASGFKVHFNLFSLLMSFLGALLVFLYKMIGFKIMDKGKISIYTMFLMAGGMILPYLYGVLFLQEEITLLKIIGLVVIILSLVISNLEEMKLDFKMIVMCILVFLLNGCVSIVLKAHQINENAVPTNDFVVVNSLFSALAGYILAFVYREKDAKNEQKKSKLKQILIVLLVAVSGGVSSFLQLKGAENLPASVLYPVITGGTVIFTALAGRIFFKEKGSLKLNVGLALCFLGTCMFL